MQRIAGEWTTGYRWGKVMETLVKMAEVLVKIAVMMMPPGGVPVPPEARGREPPSYSPSLTSYLDGRRVSPLVLGSYGVGGARAPPRLDLSLCLSLFLRSLILAFHHFFYNRRSVTPIGLKFEHDFYPDISFLAAKEGHQPPYRWPTSVRGAPRGAGVPPCLVATSGTVSRGFFFPKIIYIPKKSPSVFIPLDSV